MLLYRLIIISGILAAVSLLLTFWSGLRKWKIKTHKRFAFSCMGFGIIHVLLIIYVYFIY